MCLIENSFCFERLNLKPIVRKLHFYSGMSGITTGEDRKLFKAKAKYKMAPATDSSCEQFDPEVQGGLWNCDTYDESGHCDLNCFTGRLTFFQA